MLMKGKLILVPDVLVDWYGKWSDNSSFNLIASILTQARSKFEVYIEKHLVVVKYVKSYTDSPVSNLSLFPLLFLSSPSPLSNLTSKVIYM